jgi:hypothetical protein
MDGSLCEGLKFATLLLFGVLFLHLESQTGKLSRCFQGGLLLLIAALLLKPVVWQRMFFE